jgi:hypothetical protein
MLFPYLSSDKVETFWMWGIPSIHHESGVDPLFDHHHEQPVKQNPTPVDYAFTLSDEQLPDMSEDHDSFFRLLNFKIQSFADSLYIRYYFILLFLFHLHAAVILCCAAGLPSLHLPL